MDSKPRKRNEKKPFNVWTAYVDLFSNLMALLLLVGLVAGAAGGFAIRLESACTPVDDKSNPVSRAILSYLHSQYQEIDKVHTGPNCEIQVIPLAKQGASDARSSFQVYYRFPRGQDQLFAGLRDDDRVWQQKLLERECRDLFKIIETAHDRRQPSDNRRTAHLTFVGHASPEFEGTCHEISSTQDVPASERQIICNMDLSLRRAEHVFDFCYAHTWMTEDKNLRMEAPTGKLSNAANLFSDVVSVEGASQLDISLRERYANPDDQRRVTISIYNPAVRH